MICGSIVEAVTREIVKHPALTMALAIQPAVLTAIGASPNFGWAGAARAVYL